MEITYAHIEQLIVRQEVDGSMVHCEFRTPKGQILESSARIRRSRSMEGRMKRKVTQLVTNRTRQQVSRMARSLLGGGMLGRIGSQLIRESSSNESLGINNHTNEEKRTAVLEAFQKVQNYFDFDEVSGTWKAPIVSTKIRKRDNNKPKDRLSLFEKQVKKAPITSHYDKEILARILVELANADGEISKEEKEFLTSLIDPKLGHIDDFLEKDPISQIECEEVTAAVKETIYMMAWVMSLIDLELDEAEKDILMEYADMFGFSKEKTQELTKKAKFYIIETTVEPSISRNDLYELADTIELARDEAERALIDIKKRL